MALKRKDVLKETFFENLGEKKTGKVRDIYLKGDRIILVSTDRHSSFDRIIAYIPYKGQVLNQTSEFWFKETEDIIPNHVISVPDPNVLVAKKCQPISIEMVVRGYITGVTDTSLWTLYQKGQRDFGSFVLPEGMKKNQKLENAVLTPSTKSLEKDRTVTPQEIISEGLVDEPLWENLADISLKLFERGQRIAEDRGLILVDTKYEFGLDDNGNLVLIDEIHTPDSSRYWQAESYKKRFENGEEPDYFDKEFLRLWFKENSDPYQDSELPEAPEEMINELSERYTDIYRKITGQPFETSVGSDIVSRIKKNLKDYVTA